MLLRAGCIHWSEHRLTDCIACRVSTFWFSTLLVGGGGYAGGTSNCADGEATYEDCCWAPRDYVALVELDEGVGPSYCELLGQTLGRIE